MVVGEENDNQVEIGRVEGSDLIILSGLCCTCVKFDG